MSPIEGDDAGHPTVSQFLDVAAGAEAEVTFSYVWPSAVEQDVFELTFYPQATARPDRIAVEFVGPDGIPRRRPEAALKDPLTVSFRLDERTRSPVVPAP